MSIKQQKIETTKHKNLIIILLGFAFGIAPLSADSLAPILPIIYVDLSISISKAQLIISSYLAGFAFAHLIVGSLTDRYGRKPIIITSLILYVICSFLCQITINIETIIIIRIFQGFFSAAAIVVGRAIIRDIFDDQQVVKALAMMLTAFSIMPIITPFIGSFVAQTFHWSWMFSVMALYGILIISLIFILIPETLSEENRQSLHPVKLLNNYKAIFKSRNFIAYSFGQGLFFSGLLTNVVVAPFVIINFLDHSPVEFSFYIAVVTLGLTAGSVTSRRILNHYSINQTENLSLIILIISSSSLVILAYFEVWNIWALLLPMFMYNFAYGIFQPVALSKILKNNKHLAGTISALVGAVQFALASLITYIIVNNLGDTTFNMSMYIFILSLISILIIKVIAPKE